MNKGAWWKPFDLEIEYALKVLEAGANDKLQELAKTLTPPPRSRQRKAEKLLELRSQLGSITGMYIPRFVTKVCSTQEPEQAWKALERMAVCYTMLPQFGERKIYTPELLCIEARASFPILPETGSKQEQEKEQRIEA